MFISCVGGLTPDEFFGVFSKTPADAGRQLQNLPHPDLVGTETPCFQGVLLPDDIRIQQLGVRYEYEVTFGSKRREYAVNWSRQLRECQGQLAYKALTAPSSSDNSLYRNLRLATATVDDIMKGIETIDKHLRANQQAREPLDSSQPGSEDGIEPDVQKEWGLYLLDGTFIATVSPYQQDHPYAPGTADDYEQDNCSLDGVSSATMAVSLPSSGISEWQREADEIQLTLISSGYNKIFV